MPGASIHTDLYCLSCGYNLRGLAGDPRRCPECGFDNPMSEVTIPADMIRRELRRFETAPAIAVLFLAGTAATVAAWIYAIWLMDTVTGPALMAYSACGPLVCSTCVGIAWPFVWVSSRHSFARSCRNAPGWRGLFYHYQAVGFAGAGVVAIAVLARRELIDRLPTGTRETQPLLWLACQVVPLLVAAAAILVTARWLYPPLRERMRRMQREVAVQVAQEVLQGKLHRPRRDRPR